MKYYDARKSLYLETDASGVGMDVALLSAERQYNNIEREVLGSARVGEVPPLLLCQ